MCEVKGKTALVTGASGGIGAAIARSLAKSGAKVAVSGTREDALKALVGELGGDIIPIKANLAERGDIDKLVAEANEKLGQVDILVNNAGITRDGLAMRMKDEDWQEVLNVNLSAAFYLTRAFMKDMMKNRWGRIIGISSVVGSMGNPGQANYAAAKAGMEGMTRALAAEVATRGVTVNAVAPGFISTPMTDKLNDEQKERIAKNIPMQKFGTSENIADAVLFLASPMADYITGQTLHVNGGLWMG